MTDVAAETAIAAESEEPSVETPPFSPAYTRYALWLLMLVYVVNFLDRQVINILAEPIKKTGTYQVTAHLVADVTATFPVVVTGS